MGATKVQLVRNRSNFRAASLQVGKSPSEVLAGAFRESSMRRMAKKEAEDFAQAEANRTQQAYCVVKEGKNFRVFNHRQVLLRGQDYVKAFDPK